MKFIISRMIPRTFINQTNITFFFQETTASGLIIPDSAKEKPAAGKVIAVGPGTAEVKMEVKVGDEVLYGKYAGTELNIDGESYLMMAQRDILAVVEK